ncbi:MAG: four helix bundle protein [Phycisphaerales bacterium]|nr:MAG: four helix bundle protein [Phycisphaerales bacterium]
MPRLPADFLERVESLCDRVLDLTEALSGGAYPRRILDQISAAGTSVGANMYEANQAMSRADFVKCCGIAAKELSETIFWVRLVGRRHWIEPSRLAPLEAECLEVLKIIGAIIARTKGAPRPTV